MDENMKKVFADMFGETKKDDSTTVVSSEKTEEKLMETTTTLSSQEDTSKDESPAEESVKSDTEDSDDGVDASVLEDAKKELGIGGAAFCDELFATCPDVFRRLKNAKKTLHGLFNFAYSYALDEYVKKNGHKSGGGYWNLAELAEKYLDPNVKEGLTVGEPKVKEQTPPTAPVKAVETVKKVAKRAARSAKKAAENDDKNSSIMKTPEKTENSPKTEKPERDISGLLAGVDFSKLSDMMK